MGQSARLAVSFIIIFQLSFGHALASSGDGARSAQTSGYSDPKSQYALTIIKAADQLESGKFFNQDKKVFDAFGLLDQRVEIYQNGKIATSYELDSIRSYKPVLTYTNLTPRYDIETKELIFEATNGFGDNKQNIVARHIIPNVDIVAMTHDREMLMFIDSKGKLYAIDMGYVISQIFTSPVPVLKTFGLHKKIKSYSRKCRTHIPKSRSKAD